MKQYLRQWEILIDGEPFIQNHSIHTFRIVFDIDVSTENTVAFADIRLYNLNVSPLLASGKAITLRAGYVDECDAIFTGTITNVFKEREGPDIITRLLCSSGVANKDRGSSNSTYGSDVTILEVLQDLANQWPRYLQIDKEQFKDAPKMTSGFTAQGDIPRLLDRLKVQYGFEWTQQLGALIVTKPKFERKTPIHEISVDQGMVGIPEVGRGPNGLGVYVTTRINPFIKVSDQIEVKSRFNTYNTGNNYLVQVDANLDANGIYNILTMRYEGDSYGDAWNISIDALRPVVFAGGEKKVKDDSAVPPGEIVWGAVVNQEFRVKVKQIAQRQKLDPNWYMSIMAFETGEKFKASTPNSAGGSARGLIQFMPATARDLGTTTQQLVMMTEVEQLDYVEKYFDRYKSKIKTFSDMYMAVLWPVATGKPEDYVLWERDGQYSVQYYSNSGLDKNGDGKITKAEASSKVFAAFKKGLGKTK